MILDERAFMVLISLAGAGIPLGEAERERGAAVIGWLAVSRTLRAGLAADKREPRMIFEA
ncbi:hypothetical protein KCMC57_up07550 [Kitasatospora sp. CMC57]|uniref:Uncharacterized protein n=1 Tax=Kitasatospora sp. CMC57 TaxID=3231513 RepID=A0AB33JSK3_9ACTN